MGITDRSDLVSGVCIAAFGIYVVYEASGLAYVSEFGPGPGFLPLWIGIGLTILGLSTVFAGLLASAAEKRAEPRSWAAVGRALSGWSGLTLSIALLPWLGFGLSLALLTVFLILVLERRSPWTALSVGIGLAVGFHLIFVFALRLSLPSGPWGF
jgi:putative tricarboxylic transport membrane protein